MFNEFSLGFGWIQLLILFGCSFTMIYIINEIMGISIMAISIACEFNLTHTEVFLLTSAAFLGMILSSHYSGYKSDQIGRRASMLYTLLLSLISSIISLVMPIFYGFLFFRFLTGLLLVSPRLSDIFLCSFYLY